MLIREADKKVKGKIIRSQKFYMSVYIMLAATAVLILSFIFDLNSTITIYLKLLCIFIILIELYKMIVNRRAVCILGEHRIFFL